MDRLPRFAGTVAARKRNHRKLEISTAIRLHARYYQRMPYPAIMKEAKIDLAGNIPGEFSPADWEAILERASRQLGESTKDEAGAWADVVRDFHGQRYWGFRPDYIKPKAISEERPNLGTRFLWYSFRSFLLTKVVVLYCGARWSNDDPNPIYTWGFFGGIAFIICAYGRFLWKYGRLYEEK